MAYKTKIILTSIIFMFIMNFPNKICNAVPISLNNTDMDVRFQVWIQDVDTVNLDVYANVRVMITGFPVDADFVCILIRASEDYYLNCTNVNPFAYQGDSEILKFKIYGVGDMFPYDFYNLDMMIYPVYVSYYDDTEKYGIYEYNGSKYFIRNIEINYLSDSSASFNGDKKIQLYDTWKTKDGIFIESSPLPMKNKYYLERISYIWYSQFILPTILAMLILLSTSLFLKSYNDYILNICAMFLIFSPLNMISIRYALPHAKIMTLPEFYSLFMYAITLSFILKFMIGKIIWNHARPRQISYLCDLLDVFFFGLIIMAYEKLFFLIYNPIRNEIISLEAIGIINMISSFILILTITKLFLFFTSPQCSTFIQDLKVIFSVAKRSIMKIGRHLGINKVR